MDWLDPLAVQGTLKSLLQHHTAKTSILQAPIKDETTTMNDTCGGFILMFGKTNTVM